MRAHRGGAALVAAAIAALCARSARADDTQLVLVIEPGESLSSAVSTSLSPWEIRVQSAPGPVPSPTMPGSADRARVLAQDAGADAVVWVSTSADGPALWVYDRGGDRVVVRRLPSAPPFDPPAAAAVALSVKTLLRHSGVAPSAERYGAAAAVPAPSPEPEPEPEPEPGPARPRLRFEAGAGLRYADTGDDSLSGRVSLGASWRPARLGDRLELAAQVATGSGRDAEGPRFVGQFDDLSLSVAARLPMPLAPELSVVPAAGATLHITEIQGVLPPRGDAAGASRLDPSLDAGAMLRWSAGSGVDLGVAVGAHWLVRRQRYLVDGQPVFRLPALALEVGFLASFPIR